MRVGRTAAAWVCALAAAAGCADTTAPQPPEPTGIVAPEPLELTGDLIPIPAEKAGDLVLTRVGPAPERRAGRWPRSDIVVTEYRGDVLQLATLDLTDPDRAAPDFEALGEPGPALADGRATRRLYGPGFDADLGLAVQLSDEEAAFASGRGVSEAVLVAVLSEIDVAPTASTSPGEVIGTIPWSERSRTSATYARGAAGVYITIEAASPSVQDAYRAVAHPDPERTVDPMTELSCCARTIMNAAREVDLGPRQGWLATLTPYERILIIDGDPGIVLKTQHGAVGADDDLLQIGANLSAGSEADREDLQQKLLARQRDERAAAVEAQEEALGWTVLARVDFEEDAIILSTGTSERPWHAREDSPKLCAVMHPEGTEACIGTSPPELYAALDSNVVLVVAPTDAVTVTLEGSGEAIDLRAVDLDGGGALPARVFVRAFSLGLTSESGLGLFDAVVVARDADGIELGRAFMFQEPSLAKP